MASSDNHKFDNIKDETQIDSTEANYVQQLPIHIHIVKKLFDQIMQ